MRSLWGDLLTKKLKLLMALTLCSGTPFTLAQTEAVIAHQVAVGNRSLHLNCTGEGNPTVVMEAGYGDTSDVWAEVLPQMATFARVCVYDRAGLGRSEPVGERGVQKVVADLRALIVLCCEGPVVLVGHSVGGLLATMVAHQQPERVAGLVLIDSSHPNQQPRLHSRLPKAWLEALNTFFADAPAFETWDSNLATAQGRTPYMQAGSLGDKPLVVLTRDVTRIDPNGISWIQENIWPGYSTEVDGLYGAAWMELQRDYLALSSNSSHRIVRGSTHYIHRDKPEVVAQAVRQVVETARMENGGVFADAAR